MGFRKITSLVGAVSLVLALGCTAQEAPSVESEAKLAVEEKAPANFPETEIFLFDLDLSNTESPLTNGKNVTNRSGYDNQPFFTKDNLSFVYARDDGEQTDVYEYFIKDEKHKRLTESDKSEFSPTPSPDNTQISFVFERNLSVWHAQRGNENNPDWSFETANIEEPVGYFARNYKTGDILFWSRYGYNMTLTNADKAAYHYVTANAVPATPYVIPGTDNFSFIHRQGNGSVWIKELNPKTKAIRPLIPIVGNNANYAWAPDGAILQIEQDRLYRWTEGSAENWVEISNLKAFGIENANRLAVSPNNKMLAIVGIPADTE